MEWFGVEMMVLSFLGYIEVQTETVTLLLLGHHSMVSTKTIDDRKVHLKKIIFFTTLHDFFPLLTFEFSKIVNTVHLVNREI